MIEKLIIGTYSKENAKGVYGANFDSESGTIDNVSLVADSGAPTYLALSQNHTLYAIHQGENKGGLRIFNTTTRIFKQIDERLLFAPSPVFVMVDDSRKIVVSCNYRDGSALIYRIDEQGKLQLADSVHHEGHSVLPQQRSPHVHFATFTPEGLLAIVDLGTDEIQLFKINVNGQVVQLVSTLKMRSGFGPKKIVFVGNQIYVLGELASEVSVLDFNTQLHSFKQVQCISTIDDSWMDNNGCGGMHFSKDNKFLYVSNRGEDSIVVFERNLKNGLLKKIQSISSGGKFPRDFCLDKTERYLIAGNHRSNNVTVFKRDEKSGKLKYHSQSDAIPEAVCFVIE